MQNPPCWISLTINTLEETLGKVLYMSKRKRTKSILLEEIKNAHPIELRDDTGVRSVLEILVHVDAFAAVSVLMRPRKIWSHFRLCGSCFLSASNTRSSILLASLYF